MGGRGFRIGRLFGIELRADWSWLFVFALATWNLSGAFARWHPQWTVGGAFAVAIAATLIFFACVLVHELAHSLVARAFGLPVRDITLFLFGGVSNIEREPRSPGSELLMAAVGPATSIALGIGFIALAAASMTPALREGDRAAALASLGPAASVLLWLGPINVVIGVFNLIPGFPLDGGRILRALLWKATGQLSRATHLAAAAGKSVGWLFIGLGVAATFGLRVPYFGAGLGGGVWLAFIGWFLHGAASQASARVELEDALAGIKVGDLMWRDAHTVGPDLSVAELVRDGHLGPDEASAVPIVRGRTLLGQVSLEQVRRVARDRWADTSVESIMVPRARLAVTSPEEPLSAAVRELALRDVTQLAVEQDGALVGVLRRRDVARWVELHPERRRRPRSQARKHRPDGSRGAPGITTRPPAPAPR